MTDYELKKVLSNSTSKACRFFADNKFCREHASQIIAVPIIDKKTKNKSFSENSFAFKIDTTADSLAKLFGLNNAGPTFNDKFSEAVSGDGQEINRITRLGSSSLLAFLCFHGISVGNELIIEWEPDYKFTFDEVHFECQNPITDKENTKCSNVDILLKGKRTGTSKAAALFLESKFSEYFGRSSKYEDISSEYKTDYKAFFKNDWAALEWCYGENTIELHTKKPKDTQYCAGIKQMISHFRGLKTLANKNLSCKVGNTRHRKEVFKFDSGETDVFLGSIVFDFEGRVPDRKNALKEYQNLYKEFFDHSPRNDKFTVVPELLTYQKVFSNPQNAALLADAVKSFYMLG